MVRLHGWAFCNRTGRSWWTKCGDKERRKHVTRVLYFAHDLDDPAIWRRHAMLAQGGAEVDLVGFRRREGPLPGPARVLGRTRDARMAQRLRAVARARLGLGRTLAKLSRPDVVLARNLETLPLGIAAARYFVGPTRPKVVYEVLDIHRMMLRDDAVGHALRAAERRWLGETDLVLVSSPAFRRAHFAQQGTSPDIHLVENRVVPDDGDFRPPEPARQRRPGEPLTLGWFGVLRCEASFDCLDKATRGMPGRFRVVLRGRPALESIPGFHQRVAANPDLTFEGEYAYPDDLMRIYDEVDLTWLVDRFDAGRNSDWLLPNRYYESGAAGVPPVGLAGTEVAREMSRRGVGLLLDDLEAPQVATALSGLTTDRLAGMRDAQRAVPRSAWVAGRSDARALVARLRGIREVPPPTEPAKVPA